MQAYATPATGFSPQLRLLDRPASLPPTAGTDAGTAVLDQLLGQLADLVAERVANRLAAPTHDRGDEWMDTRGGAEYLGVGRDSLRRLAAEGTIPTEQAGSGCKLYFRRSDLDEWRRSSSGPMQPARARRHG